MRILNWQSLNAAEQQRILDRPAQARPEVLQQQVAEIIAAVRSEGDAAVLRYTRRFDCETLDSLAYPVEKIDQQAAKLAAKTRAAIDLAFSTITRFHKPQRPQQLTVETAPGVICSQRFHPLDAVGLYVPGGSAVLPSTAMMLGIPAQLAGCARRVLVSPPDANGDLSPALMYVAQKCGITEVYRCGGAQAIAALAYGTETIAPVVKIFGPGNSYVTAAKQQVSQDASGAAIDMPAGPSELLVIADDTANPAYVAADLLSQAEHGADSQVILLSPSADLLKATAQAIEQQLTDLPRADVARQALQTSSLVQVNSIAEAVVISQRYAPEHLSLQLDDTERWLDQLTNAGSVFVGHYTPESGGDYATGTNHVLPTYGFARNYSSLGLLDFYRRYTVQQASREGLAGLADAIVELAQTEGLDAHARAVSIRLQQQQGEPS
ncbi:histidinol dehydrogenase [Pseudidiomarina salinarum]|uniref:Histidinol dehydrogenase n=1 Tax=Pseudidiomarina salinarum TaxID=435908 RepID=A0A094IWW5_9GAMM|nr:histidinol dehydrogenase [Pseudidiomarina salinarum]KFZ31617.1 histidinol dehydrogenase [Pseudidiomarina salinarum]RUO70615.1 histidinol dehydrogenase [Pseudidiomarina salinarum]